MSGNEYRKAIERMLDGIDAKGLERIYYLLLGRTGIVIDAEGRKRKC